MFYDFIPFREVKLIRISSKRVQGCILIIVIDTRVRQGYFTARKLGFRREAQPRLRLSVSTSLSFETSILLPESSLGKIIVRKKKGTEEENKNRNEKTCLTFRYLFFKFCSSSSFIFHLFYYI
jgi:hypothetical protein